MAGEGGEHQFPSTSVSATAPTFGEGETAWTPSGEWMSGMAADSFTLRQALGQTLARRGVKPTALAAQCPLCEEHFTLGEEVALVIRGGARRIAHRACTSHPVTVRLGDPNLQTWTQTALEKQQPRSTRARKKAR